MRQIFCKLPNPFPYLNYITKFFFGRKSYRQRVFQGPLTLGLQSPSLRASSFRLACGNPSIPARSQLTAQTAHLLLLHSSVCVGYNRPLHSAGALAGFPARVLPRSHITALNRAPAVLHLSVRVGYNRPFHSAGALAGFSCSGTRAQSYHRANRAPVTFASFCLRRLQPTFATRLHQQ